MESVSMDEKKEQRLIEIAKGIVEMTDSVIGVTGKIAELNSDDLRLFKNWFEQIAGHELKIPQDALEVRKYLIDYLKNNNIEVPEEPKYETEQYNFSTSVDFFNSWNNDDMFSSRGSR